MDTKSKNYRYSAWIKLLAALLCVAGAVCAAAGVLFAQDYRYALQAGDYKDSDDYAWLVTPVYEDVCRAVLTYKSEQNIRSGGCLEADDEYRGTVSAWQEESQSAVNALRSDYQQRLNEAWSGGDKEVEAALAAELDRRIQAEQENLAQKIAGKKDETVARQLQDYQATMARLGKLDGVHYLAAPAGGSAVTNVPGGKADEEYFKALPASLVVHGGETNALLRRGYSYYRLAPEGATVCVGLAPDRYSRESAAFAAHRATGLAGVYRLCAGLLAFLLGLCWLMYAAGRRPKAEGVRLLGADRIYLDAGLAAAVAVIAACVAGLYGIYSQILYGSSINLDIAYAAGAALAVAIALTAMLYLTALSRRVKRREALKHALIYRLLAWIFRKVRAALDAGPAALKAALLFCGYAFASCLFFYGMLEVGRSGGGATLLVPFLLFLAVNAAALLFLARKASTLQAILAGVKRIKAGELGHRLKAEGGAAFAELADSVNNIAVGLNAAVESEVRSERMKAELITNVSHDLKTPLTSIITYIDLLKAEGPGSENAAQYISVLDAKAQRLKTLTEDLFEAAKAASGSISPKLECLDLCELLRQGMGEMGDRIQESGLEFRVGIPQEKLFISADGRLLWRVMENLLSNVFKYAMPGSRVYISALREGGDVRIAVKNISAQELNMPPEELTERFTRGDEARAGEGSGLGLAIAKSLVELQGGTFRIDIDGDLFKAVAEFKEIAQEV